MPPRGPPLCSDAPAQIWAGSGERGERREEETMLDELLDVFVHIECTMFECTVYKVNT